MKSKSKQSVVKISSKSNLKSDDSINLDEEEDMDMSKLSNLASMKSIDKSLESPTKDMDLSGSNVFSKESATKVEINKSLDMEDDIGEDISTDPNAEKIATVD